MINSNDGEPIFPIMEDELEHPIQSTYAQLQVIADRKALLRIWWTQDNSSVAIASRTDDGGIDHKIGRPGCESAFIAFDLTILKYSMEDVTKVYSNDLM